MLKSILFNDFFDYWISVDKKISEELIAALKKERFKVSFLRADNETEITVKVNAETVGRVHDIFNNFQTTR